MSAGGAVWLALVLVDVGVVVYGSWVRNRARRAGDDARARAGLTIAGTAFVAMLALVASGVFFVFAD